jgi:hypothetical protein
VAGWEGDRPRAGLEVDKQIDAAEAIRRRSALMGLAATEAARRVAADRRRARRGANRRRRATVLAFLAPWLVGFSASSATRS